MTELDLYQDKAIVRLAAIALAKLHSLTSTGRASTSNMLWRSCHVLMQQYADPQWKVDPGDGHAPWTFDRLYSCIRNHEAELAREDDLLTTVCGHGDCKPSNLLVQGRNHGETPTSVRFLDMELAGRHYIAYDLAKLWRTSSPLTVGQQHQRDQHQRIFLETYAEHFPGETVTASALRHQIDRLLPLTWLEAAVFFVAMSSSSSQNPSDRGHWDALALDRLRSYEKSLSHLAS